MVKQQLCGIIHSASKVSSTEGCMAQHRRIYLSWSPAASPVSASSFSPRKAKEKSISLCSQCWGTEGALSRAGLSSGKCTRGSPEATARVSVPTSSTAGSRAHMHTSAGTQRWSRITAFSAFLPQLSPPFTLQPAY